MKTLRSYTVYRVWCTALVIALWIAGPVYAGLQMSVDQRALFFGLMQLGQEKELAQYGSHHNTITCVSDNGRAWALKVSVLQPLTSGLDEIPLDNFRWQVVRSTGIGMSPAMHRYVPFSLAPDLVYLSSPQEATGTAVRLDVKYRLEIPEYQLGGSYQTIIRFTLTEIL